MPSDIWTIGAALDWTRGYLEKKGDERPRLSAELLLAGATGLDRIHLYTDFDRPLTEKERAWLRDGVKRRGEGEPLQYISGKAPFRHLELLVGPGVLIPRPETEILVDQVISVLHEGKGRVLDLCTGCGAIALSLATEVPEVEVWATDISSDALIWAHRNLDLLESNPVISRGSIGEPEGETPRQTLSKRVHFLEGDLASPIPRELFGTFDVVVSNPPYIPTRDMADLPREVAAFEPSLALDGGEDGFAVFSRISEAACTLLRSGGYLCCELDENYVATAAAKRVEWSQDVNVVKDLTGRDRIVTAKAP